MIDIRMETHANLGYVLARPFWNRGYMTEAVVAVSSWALEQEEIARVWAVCDVENIASARVLEKAGFEREGMLERWMVLPNRGTEPRDCYCYGKVKKRT
jgi:ribosomal-protein-alanine N-acetyltransferase